MPGHLTQPAITVLVSAAVKDPESTEALVQLAGWSLHGLRPLQPCLRGKENQSISGVNQCR